MMKKNSWRHYILPRAAALCVCEIICAAVILVILAICPDGAGVPPFLVPAASFVQLILAVELWRLVIRPYREMENEGMMFLNGYTPESELVSAKYQCSPVIEKLMELLSEQISPSRVFDQNKRRAQYLALQNQINPHFLYNTLDSIRSEAMLAGLNNVADMTEALASFFRYTISKTDDLVSLEEELQNCSTYFKIQKYRFEDRLQMKVECPPESWEDIRRCRLPKLTLQPILENSIIHGTELKLGVGMITIFLETTQKRLLIRVSDNGVGMDEETLARLNGRLGKNALGVREEEQSKGGLALVNVDHRIRLLFGDEYGLHVFSVPGCGTDVEVSIPIVTSDNDIPDREVFQ